VVRLPEVEAAYTFVPSLLTASARGSGPERTAGFRVVLRSTRARDCRASRRQTPDPPAKTRSAGSSLREACPHATECHRDDAHRIRHSLTTHTSSLESAFTTLVETYGNLADSARRRVRRIRHVKHGEPGIRVFTANRRVPRPRGRSARWCDSKYHYADNLSACRVTGR